MDIAIVILQIRTWINAKSSKSSTIKYAALLYIINTIKDVWKLISKFTCWYWKEPSLSFILLLPLYCFLPWILSSYSNCIFFSSCVLLYLSPFFIPQSLCKAQKPLNLDVCFMRGERWQTKIFFSPQMSKIRQWFITQTSFLKTYILLVILFTES